MGSSYRNGALCALAPQQSPGQGSAWPHGPQGQQRILASDNLTSTLAASGSGGYLQSGKVPAGEQQGTAPGEQPAQELDRPQQPGLAWPCREQAPPSLSPCHQPGPGPSNRLSTTATTLLPANKGGIFLEMKHLPKTAGGIRGRSDTCPGLPSTSLQLQSCSGEKLSARHGPTTGEKPSLLLQDEHQRGPTQDRAARSRWPCPSPLHPPEQEHPQPPAAAELRGEQDRPVHSRHRRCRARTLPSGGTAVLSQAPEELQRGYGRGREASSSPGPPPAPRPGAFPRRWVGWLLIAPCHK